MRVDTLGIVLAAGASRRFGMENKLLSVIEGRPLVSHAAQAMAQCGCDRLAAVVSDVAIYRAFPTNFDMILIPPDQEMFLSFRAAINAARDMRAARLLIALGDMPNVHPCTFGALLALGTDGACISDGRRMPPVVLVAPSYDAAWYGAMGDSGARGIIAGLASEHLVHLPRNEAIDIDTRADLAAQIS